MPTCFFLRMFYWIWIVTLKLKSTPISELSFLGINVWTVSGKRFHIHPMFLFPGTQHQPPRQCQQSVRKINSPWWPRGQGWIHHQTGEAPGRFRIWIWATKINLQSTNIMSNILTTSILEIQVYTLQGINISHLGKRKIIFKHDFW